MPALSGSLMRYLLTVNCERFIANPADPDPGLHCVNPPPQSRDYPFYVAASSAARWAWKEVGGLNISGLLNGFGGSSRTEYGALLDTNFHRTLPGNPLPGMSA